MDSRALERNSGQPSVSARRQCVGEKTRRQLQVRDSLESGNGKKRSREVSRPGVRRPSLEARTAPPMMLALRVNVHEPLQGRDPICQRGCEVQGQRAKWKMEGTPTERAGRGEYRRECSSQPRRKSASTEGSEALDWNWSDPAE